MGGTLGPSGCNLIRLARKSNAVTSAPLLLARRDSIALAANLRATRAALSAAMEAIDRTLAPMARDLLDQENGACDRNKVILISEAASLFGQTGNFWPTRWQGLTFLRRACSAWRILPLSSRRSGTCQPRPVRSGMRGAPFVCVSRMDNCPQTFNKRLLSGTFLGGNRQQPIPVSSAGIQQGQRFYCSCRCRLAGPPKLEQHMPINSQITVPGLTSKPAFHADLPQ